MVWEHQMEEGETLPRELGVREQRPPWRGPGGSCCQGLHVSDQEDEGSLQRGQVHGSEGCAGRSVGGTELRGGESPSEDGQLLVPEVRGYLLGVRFAGASSRALVFLITTSWAARPPQSLVARWRPSGGGRGLVRSTWSVVMCQEVCFNDHSRTS